MSNHMTALGFPVTSDSTFGHYAAMTQINGEPISHAFGGYRRLPAGGGAELWLETDRNGSIVQMNPHFFGAAQMRVRIEARIQTARGAITNNAFKGWALSKHDDDEASDGFPIVFDSPDFHLYDSLELPIIEPVQLAAFAETLDVFSDETELGNADAGGLPYAVKAFVPLHNFKLREDDTSVAYARISGPVIETKLIENLFTPDSFCWAKLETYCGEVDIVVDPAILPRPLMDGDIVAGIFWLSGRIPRLSSSESMRQRDREAEPKLETPQDYLERAKHFGWTRGRYDKGLVILKEAARIFPDIATIFFELGNFHEEQNEHREAIEAFERALEIAPDQTLPFMNLANAYRSDGEYGKAIALCNRWMATANDDWERDSVHYSLALTEAAMGNFDEAERICREEISFENRVRDLRGLGLNFSSLGRHEAAIRLLEEARDAAPDDAHANFDLGAAYVRANRRDQATKQYERLLEINERWAKALLDQIETVH
ncbi:MAG TPA: tetratricopeptide repeat protein [Pyrinomonadaceae bacterium]|jgi:Flp pilus assembly protein TadD|nr:tetratricopeptide repeat protein [Pyrinomonadaceae bacterium]